MPKAAFQPLPIMVILPAVVSREREGVSGVAGVSVGATTSARGSSGVSEGFEENGESLADVCELDCEGFGVDGTKISLSSGMMEAVGVGVT